MLGKRGDSMGLKLFSNPNNLMILFFKRFFHVELENTLMFTRTRISYQS